LKVLKLLLDSSNVQYVSMHKFSEFLKSFGPIMSKESNCIKNMKMILREKWFYSFLSKAESEHMLDDTQTGTFLVRFSKSKMGSFAIAFKSKNRIIHIMVTAVKPLGFKVLDNQTKKEKIFPSIQQLLSEYSYALKTPLDTELPYKIWFQGDLNSMESSELLQGMEPGTFLMRLSSSQSGSFVVSFVDPSELSTISHLMIKRTIEGYELEGPESLLSINRKYPSLDELIKVILLGSNHLLLILCMESLKLFTNGD